MEFKMYDHVYFDDKMYIYLGMDEDGALVMFRKTPGCAYDLIEFEHVYVADEDEYDKFLEENGEPLSMKYERKGIKFRT